MRVSVRPRHTNKPRPAWKTAEAFKQWIRGRECACGGSHDDCGGNMEAAHVDYAAKGTMEAKGASTKVADRWCIPLSRNCHALQHRKGWPWFDQHILGGISRGEMMASEYWRLWPGRARWEREREMS